MSILLILLLCLAACLLLTLQWRRCGWAAYGVVVVFALSVGCGWLPQLVLTQLQAPYAERPLPAWGARNAIVLLGMATEKIPGSGEVEINSFAYGRITQTAALYRACKESKAVCRVVVSGGDARGYGKPEAEVYGAYLIQLGVSAKDLLLEGSSLNTWQNAQFTSALLRAQTPGFDRVWLVSSAVHLGRSISYFRHFGTETTPVRADYLSAPTSVIPLGYNYALMDVALHEYTGIWRKRLYDALGWNVAATRPGDV